jgi:hypothetical protein
VARASLPDHPLALHEGLRLELLLHPLK